MGNGLTILRLVSDEAIAEAFAVMVELRPHLQRETFVEQVRAQERGGYRLLAGHEGDRIVVVAGFRIATTLARGRHLFVDDLVTAANRQGMGYGQTMLKYLARLARQEQIGRIWLDSRDSAKTFYEKVGFAMHTSLPCWIDVNGM